MTLYALVISIHVITAILGLGTVMGIAILSSSATLQGPSCAGTWLALQRLAVTMRWSILVLLLSGAALDFVAHGAYHATWWFRLSVLLLVVLGALNGRMRRALRKGQADGDDRVLAGVTRNAWAMCAVVALAAFFMEAKPW